MDQHKIVGKPALRVDAPLKVTGKAQYVDDLKLPGMLYGKVLRSNVPHGFIKEIDASGAYRIPEVKAVVTGSEFSYRHGLLIKDEPFLAQGKVRYIGEAVVAVAATTEEAAQKGIDSIRVTYELLPPVFDPQQAIQPGGPLIHEELSSYSHSEVCQPIPNSNICSYFKLRKGDVERAFKAADYLLENTYVTSVNQHAALEPHAAIALFDPSGKITVGR
jgi:carbon-monoxide dehydrogenase large subunit